LRGRVCDEGVECLQALCFALGQFVFVGRAVDRADGRERGVGECRQCGVFADQSRAELGLFGGGTQPVTFRSGLELLGAAGGVLPAKPETDDPSFEFCDGAGVRAVGRQTLLAQPLSAGELLGAVCATPLEEKRGRRTQQRSQNGDQTGEKGLHARAHIHSRVFCQGWPIQPIPPRRIPPFMAPLGLRPELFHQ
jgi:hypothetical protein